MHWRNCLDLVRLLHQHASASPTASRFPWCSASSLLQWCLIQPAFAYQVASLAADDTHIVRDLRRGETCRNWCCCCPGTTAVASPSWLLLLLPTASASATS